MAERDLKHELSLMRLERFATSGSFFKEIVVEKPVVRFEILQTMDLLEPEEAVDYFDKFTKIEKDLVYDFSDEEFFGLLIDSLHEVQGRLADRHEEVLANQRTLTETQNARLDRIESALHKIRDYLVDEPLSDGDLQDYVLRAVDDLIEALAKRDSGEIETAYARLVLAEREERYSNPGSKDKSRIRRIGHHALIALRIISDIAGPTSLYLAISEREQRPIADLVYELDEQPQIGPGESGEAPALESGDC